MELFTAGDESQMEVIKQRIDESDVYLMILAGRYGSIEPNSGKSYTQLEYAYAVAQEKPLFACVINSNALDERIKTRGKNCSETDNPQKLEEFKALILSKMVRFWDDTKDIKISVGETLAHFSRREDLKGWIRSGDEVNTPALADEIARLSKENATLRNQISNTSQTQDLCGLSVEEMYALLEDKQLLELFMKKKYQSGGQFGTYLDDADFKELCRIGLLEERGHRSYTLTDHGRIFLNKIEAKALLQDKE